MLAFLKHTEYKFYLVVGAQCSEHKLVSCVIIW